jgi:hypothetical protein
MTWEQKFEAINALSDTSLRMRSPGDWYIDCRGREVGGDGFLTGMYGNGRTPEEAVNDDFEKMTTVEYPKYIRIGDGNGGHIHVRWTGFMWRTVGSETK